MTGLEKIIRSQPFLAGFAEDHIALISGCARNHRFEAGQYLFHESDPADEFFLVRKGRVSLEIVAPGQAPIVFSTLGEGEIVGASWLVPPYRWTFDARAAELVLALGMDGACLRGKCEADHDLGYEMMKRFAPILIKRLQATRLQILNVYGKR
jgi:CRP/FNR family transcriptional regulator, cyclic AMP receptor protein